MKFIYAHYIPVCILVCLLLAFYLYKCERNFFEWIKTYWPLKRSQTGRISSLILTIALSLMIFSLLDLRGLPEKIESRVTDQKTIILIDNSTSMLVQDVRPSRFQRAIVLARHFIKKSVGHQISLILFSDTHKKILPFTDDLDLLDARLAGLKNLNPQGGGSGIAQAIAESINYFRHENSHDKENLTGNILLFTDAEEHDSNPINFAVPKGINLAVVAIGTQSGGKIPLRNSRGVFMGYKRHKGREIISKLVESNIKAIGKDFTNFKHWITLSYNIPTEDILVFFRTSFKKHLSNRITTIRPIFMHYLILPAIILYAFYAVFFKMPSFSFLMLLILAVNIKGSDGKKEINQQIVEKFKKGFSSVEEKGQLAKNYLDNGEYEKAKHIYKDIIENNTKKDIPHLFNYATSLLYSGDVPSAMNLYSKLTEQSHDNSLKEKIQNNISHFLKQLQQQNNQKNKEKKKKDKQQESDKKENKNQKDQQSSGSNDKKQEEDDKKENKNQASNDKKEQQSSEEKDLKNDSKQSVEEREKDIQQKRKLTKIPILLKKLMQDDRGLQEKFIDTRTQNRQYSRDKKDW